MDKLEINGPSACQPRHSQPQWVWRRMHNTDTMGDDKRTPGERTWHGNCAFVVYTHLVAACMFLWWKPHPATVTLTLAMWLFAGMGRRDDNGCRWGGDVYNCEIGLGITMGYHRLWSHRAFKAAWPLRLFLALMGTLSFQGSIKWWVERHRLHHRFTDTANDPYNAKRGFWFSHIGWIMKKPFYPLLPLIDASDLHGDPGTNTAARGGPRVAWLTMYVHGISGAISAPILHPACYPAWLCDTRQRSSCVGRLLGRAVVLWARCQDLFVAFHVLHQFTGALDWKSGLFHGTYCQRGLAAGCIDEWRG